MTAIERLKEKIEGWKSRIRELEESNKRLQKEKEELVRELKECGGGDSRELKELKEQLALKEETITLLQQELRDKDEEIEDIITKVEALLE